MPSETTRRLHPASILFSLLAAIRAFVGPAVVAIVLSPGRFEIWLGLLALPAGVGAVVRYWFYRYRLGEDGLVVRRGLLSRSERHVPYARIQNVNVKQTLLHRAFRVAEVQLETAGGDEPEATMRVLGLDEVEAIRERVASARRLPGAAATAGAAAAERDVVLHLPAREVLLFGLLSNRGMVMVAAAMGVLWQFDLPGIDPADGDLWRRVAERADGLPVPGVLVSALAGLGLVLVAVLLLRGLSAVWAVLRFHDFTLTRAGDDLRAERGLLTRVAATVPRRRIQLVSLSEGWLHRKAGRVGIRVETAGGTAGGEAEGGGENLWMAPLVASDAAARVVRTLVPELDLDALEWRPISSRALGRITRRNLLLTVPVAIGIAVAALVRSPWALLALPALAGWAVLAARLRVRYTHWALGPDVVALRSGWWVRQTSAVTYAKVQAVALAANPFDRRRRMARVDVDTAGAGRVGHRVSVPYLDAADARAVHDHVEREASARAFRW